MSQATEIPVFAAVLRGSRRRKYSTACTGAHHDDTLIIRAQTDTRPPDVCQLRKLARYPCSAFLFLFFLSRDLCRGVSIIS